MKNRYPGDCSTCGAYVAREAGSYESGNLYCGERDFFEGRDEHGNTIWIDACPVRMARLTAHLESPEGRAEREAIDAARADQQERIRLGWIERIPTLATEARVRSLEQVITKVTGRTAAPADLTRDEAAAVVNELERRIDRREAAKDPCCRKCHGTGAYWRADGTGRYFDDGCWPCNGTGKKAFAR